MEEGRLGGGKRETMKEKSFPGHIFERQNCTFACQRAEGRVNFRKHHFQILKT